MIGLLLAFKKDKPSIDVSAHADDVTTLILYAIVLLIAFFVVRPELWRRIFLVRVDPRPAALMRIAFGFVVLWTFLDLAFTGGQGAAESNFKFLFTDEGLWLTDMARRNYSGNLKTLWDPEQGFEHWYDLFKALWGRMSILHFRSDPPFVMAVFGAMYTCLTLMILGVRTRLMTVLSWFLVESAYRYSPIYFTGGDTVTRCFMFLGMFVNWGQAYSFDAWWRRRKAVLGGARTVPALRLIPAWPMRIMYVQLAIIYCATGLLKSGKTWKTGTALYYALNLDHFYRVPATGLVGAGHFSGLLPISAIITHWWEMLFPLVILGMMINCYERERRDGSWPTAAIWRRLLGWLVFMSAWVIGAHVAGVGAHYYLLPKDDAPFGIPREQLIPTVRMAVAVLPVVLLALYVALRRFLPRIFDFVRTWLLGRRVWLVLGFNLHVGIDISMNVGVFANVMMSVYFVWLSGAEIDLMWRTLFSRGKDPEPQERFKKVPPKLRRIVGFFYRHGYRATHRRPGKRYTIVHGADDTSLRHAALLRCWDLGYRLDFQADADSNDGDAAEGRSTPAGPAPLRVIVEGRSEVLSGGRAGQALIKIFPGLWVLRPFSWIPVVGPALGSLALYVLKQK